MPKPEVSFIIPAFDEEVCLPRTLASVHAAAKAAGVAYEVIVVDDASADRTAEVAREHGAIVHRVELRQIAAVRNAGARRAKGECFIFVDADTVLPPATLAAALAALKGGAVGGGCLVRFDGRIPLYASILLPVFTRLFRLSRLAAGCFIYCSREAFDAAGGFDEDYFASEEVWFSLALRRQGTFVVLKEHVITSGRKVRTHSGWHILGTLLRLSAGGMKATKRREGLEIWYESRRETSLPGEAPGAEVGVAKAEPGPQ